MRVITTCKEFQEFCHAERFAGRTTALVPSMGYFHEGHLSLMRYARQKADKVFLSLFVNPSQFGPGEDLASYPRDFKRDAALAEAQGVDALFAPSQEEMYPPGYATWVEVPELGRNLCALARPVHFKGVATVVTKLLLLALPSFAVFGEKDWQQLAIIKRLAADLNLPVRIEGHPIVRESDGLAMSSRNIYLSPAERAQAPELYQGLRLASRLFAQPGLSPDELFAQVKDHYRVKAPLCELDYLELVDPYDLSPKEDLQGPGLMAVAARFGRARLIDNILLRA